MPARKPQESIRWESEDGKVFVDAPKKGPLSFAADRGKRAAHGLRARVDAGLQSGARRLRARGADEAAAGEEGFRAPEGFEGDRSDAASRRAERHEGDRFGKGGKRAECAERVDEAPHAERSRASACLAAFREFYRSHDGRFIVYEDGDGHLTSVDSSRLA